MNELHEIMKTQSSDINYNDAYNQKKKKKERKKGRTEIIFWPTLIVLKK